MNWFNQRDAMMGDAMMGDAMMGDAMMGDAMMGDAMIGDAMMGDAMMGDAMMGDAMMGDAMMGDAMNRVSTRVVWFWEQCCLSLTFAPVETSIYRVSEKNNITNTVDLSRLLLQGWMV